MTEAATAPAPGAAPQAPPPPMQLMQMIMGYWLTQSIGTAAELGVADHLADGPRPIAALAAATGVHAEGLYRLIRALAGVGLFVEQPGADRAFALAPMGELLRRGVPGSMRDMARMNALPAHYASWGKLIEAVRTNQPVFQLAHQAEDIFAYYMQDSVEAEAFNGAMTALSSLAAQVIPQAYDWARFKKIVDVGGGHGALLAAILGAAPAASGVLFDLPVVIGAMAPDAPGARLAGRIEAVGGDFFAGVPAGGDAYVMKHILHDWDDERAAKILRSIRAAIGAEGRLVVIEMVVPPGSGPDLSKLMDLNMLVLTPGGRERTAGQWEALFAAGGFRLAGVTPTPSPYAILEGVPA